MEVRIAIADEYTLIRRGVLSMIMNIPATTKSTYTDTKFTVTGDASTPTELLVLLSKNAIDILFLGFSLATYQSPNPLSGMDGVLLIKWLNHKYPKLKIVVLSPYKNKLLVRMAMEAGAKAYISRDICEKTLWRTLISVTNDEVYIERELMNSLFRNTKQDNQELTPREIDVLRMLCKGLNLTDIAQQMHLSNKTVSAHKLRAMEKLGVQSDCQLYCLMAKMQMFDIAI
ncbi:response regulator transcription factor [Enterobacter sp. RHBSTW-00994]|uniref:LuxR C-terminal-related transcriptional regulator n=1 Tax=Enterobacter sp. RHBSTW-00994 TaxID=2742676 RepID=UPI0015E95900|nr:response regulator transcription factor [Enterobacter sp. RHBSTW-00994]QLR43351.1 response regulator transcription factor [Enterobacter sp. RHBSTW-00994]